MKSGISLVELIVVISIIIAIFAIILPSIQASRERAEDVICMQNQKQMTLALLLYENENKKFPYCNRADMFAVFNKPPGDFFGYLQSSSRGWWWQNYMETYLEDFVNMEKLIVCPSRNVSGSQLKGDILRSNYGVNMSICKKYSVNPGFTDEFSGTSLSINNIPSPSKTVLILDSGYNMINYQQTGGFERGVYIPGASTNKDNFISGQDFDAISGRHSNRTINSGFLDGSVKRKKADDFTVIQGVSDENISPLWSPR